VVASPASKLARRLLRRNLFMCSSRVRAVPLWPPHVGPAPTGGPALARACRSHGAGGGSVVPLQLMQTTPTNDTPPSTSKIPKRLGIRLVTEGSRLVTRPKLLVNTRMRKNRKAVSGDGRTPLPSPRTAGLGPPEARQIGSEFGPRFGPHSGGRCGPPACGRQHPGPEPGRRMGRAHTIWLWPGPTDRPGTPQGDSVVGTIRRQGRPAVSLPALRPRTPCSPFRRGSLPTASLRAP